MDGHREAPQKLIKDASGVIESYPPFDAGTALGTVTVRVGTPSTAMPTSGSAATQDATSTTLAAAASIGDTTLTITALSAWGDGARRFLVKGTDGLYHDVEVEPPAADVSSAAVTLAEPLPFAAASGAAFVGYRCSVALTTTDTATIGPGVAEWEATWTDAENVAHTHKWTTTFRIVERDGTYTLTPTVLTSSSPYCRDHRPDNDDDFTETIDAAWRRYVQPALLGKALRPERIVSTQHLEPVHIAACEHYLAQQFDDDERRRAEIKAELAHALDQALAASDLWITSEVEDLTNADPNALGLVGNAAGVMPVGTYADGTYVGGLSDLNVQFITR